MEKIENTQDKEVESEVDTTSYPGMAFVQSVIFPCPREEIYEGECVLCIEDNGRQAAKTREWSLMDSSDLPWTAGMRWRLGNQNHNIADSILH